MKFTGQIRIPDLDHPGVPATFLIEGTQAEVILEGEESLGRWSLFDVQARRLISAAFEVELDGEEVTFIADEPIDFAYRGLEEMASVWARFKSMNIVRRKVAVSRSRNGVRTSRIHELRGAMEENLGIQAKSVSLPGTSRIGSAGQDLHEGHVWDSPTRKQTPVDPEPPADGQTPLDPIEDEPSIPLISAPPREDQTESGAPTDRDSDEADSLAAELEAIGAEKARLDEQLRATGDEIDDEAATLASERKAIEEERARLDEQLRATEDERDEAASLASERKAIEEERARLAEERSRLEDLHREAEKREQDRVEAFRLEMQRLDRERKEFERLEEERRQAHREAMEKMESERVDIEKKTAEMTEREREDAERASELQTRLAEMSQREQEDAEKASELQARLAEMSQREKEDAEQAVELRAKLAELEQERVRREREESERVEAAQREMEALEEQQRRIESLEELREEPTGEEEPSTSDEPEPVEEASEPEVPREEVSASAPADSKFVDLAELEESLSDEGDDEEDGKSGPKHLRSPERRRRPGAKRGTEPDIEPDIEQERDIEPEPKRDIEPDPALARAAEPEPDIEPETAFAPAPEAEPALAGAGRQSGIMGAVRAAFGRGGREHVHDFVEAPGGLGIARSICRECGYVSISTED